MIRVSAVRPGATVRQAVRGMISSHIRATVNASIEPGQQHSPAVAAHTWPIGPRPDRDRLRRSGGATPGLSSGTSPVLPDTRRGGLPELGSLSADTEARSRCSSSIRARITAKSSAARGRLMFPPFLVVRVVVWTPTIPSRSAGPGRIPRRRRDRPCSNISGAASCAVHVLPRTSSPMDSLVPDSATAQVSITVLSVTQMPRCRRASSSPSRRRDRHRASAERINRKFDDEGLYFRGSNFILRLFGSPRPGRGRPQPCGAWPRRFCLGRQCWRSFSLIGRALFRSNPPASTVCCGPFC